MKRQERHLIKHKAAIDEFSVKEKSGVSGGIVGERKCTDVWCCVLLVLVLGAMVGMAIYGGTSGNATRLLAPLDGARNFCGEHDPAVGVSSDYKYLYLPDLGNPEGSLQEIF